MSDNPFDALQEAADKQAAEEDTCLTRRPEDIMVEKLL